MYSYGRQKCSEPRDRVYGLQNLLEPQARIPVNYAAEPAQLLEQAMRAAIEESFRKPWNTPCNCEEDSETLGLMFADALLGPAYPVNVLVVLQELAWLLCWFEFTQRRSDILDGYKNLQQFLCLARTPEQRRLAEIIQLEIARLAIHKLGYGSWDSLRRDISAEPFVASFWEHFDTAVKKAYGTSLPLWGPPGLSRAFSSESHRLMQEDLVTAVNTAIAACGYDIRDGYITKPEGPSFRDLLDNKVCHWATNETNPQLCTLMHRRRDAYRQKVHEARSVFYNEYATALGSWDFIVAGKWETRVGLGGVSGL